MPFLGICTHALAEARRYHGGSGYAYGPQIAVANDGSAIAVSPGIGFGGYGLSLGIDGIGNALAVWSQDDGTRWNVCSNRWLAP